MRSLLLAPTCPINFIISHSLQLSGYQFYAVEKWIVERNPILSALTVYTGDPSHRVLLIASYPPSQQQWDDTIHLLKQEGARPRTTNEGTLMLTSLANFRSDFTIIHIPNGNFLSVTDHLYANINLLRLGCSGRSAVTLQDPSDSTKSRFTDLYHLPSSRDESLFVSTVLEFVKLLQAALTIFGTFRCDIDGLLCDHTVQAIQRWVTDIAEPCIGLEPMERIADPVLVSTLLSFLLAIRNNLAAIGYAHVTPKDPFLHPHAFLSALASYLHLSSPISASNSNSTTSSIPSTGTVLTRSLVQSIRAAYDKPRQTDTRKVRRALMNKLDDFVGGSDGDGEGKEGKHTPRITRVGTPSGSVASGESSGQIFSGIASGLGLGGVGSGAGGVMDPIMDLSTFVSIVVGKDRKTRGMGIGRGRSKDSFEWEWDEKEKDVVAGSIRCLWSGRVENVVIIRKRAHRKSEDKVHSDGDAEDEHDRERTTEDECDPSGRPWSNRMQKKIESWAGLGWKRPNNELTHSKTTGRNDSRSQSPVLPVVIVSGDPLGEEEDLLSSGQVSPVSEPRVNPFGVFHAGMSAEDSALNLDAAASDYERRVTAFNQKRPSQSRVSSWSDPISAWTGEDIEGKNRSSWLRTNVIMEEVEPAPPAFTVKRRRSFHDLESYRDVRVLNIDWMKIDVELCGQLLVMTRRDRHLQNVVACLQVLTSSLSTTNTRLREDYHAHQPFISDLDSRTRVIASLEAQHAQTVTSQETNALLYESEQFRLPELWRAVSLPRQQVLDLRDKAFGTGRRRLPAGVRGAHGRFNRLQWTLDGRERLVDWMGRTESEEEEENAVEVAEVVVPPEEEEEDVVEHPGIKPMWLLRFFNTWGAKWGGPPSKKQTDGKRLSPKHSVDTDAPI